MQLQHAAPRAAQQGMSSLRTWSICRLTTALASGEAGLLLMQRVWELAGADSSSSSSFCPWR